MDQGRVFGRGACDVKGAMACMLTAFARLAAERPPDMPTLIMACTVNEENGFAGARVLAQSWADGTSPILPRPAGPGDRGRTDWLACGGHAQGCGALAMSRGRAARPTVPARTPAKTRSITWGTRCYNCSVVPRSSNRVAGDPRLGPPTLNVGTIHGGICVNAVPDRCTIEIDRRLIARGSSRDGAATGPRLADTTRDCRRPITARSAVSRQSRLERPRQRRTRSTTAAGHSETRRRGAANRRSLRHERTVLCRHRRADGRVRPGFHRAGAHRGRMGLHRSAAHGGRSVHRRGTRRDQSTVRRHPE